METITQSMIIANLIPEKNWTMLGIRKTSTLDGLVNYCSDNPPTNDLELAIKGYVFVENTGEFVYKSLPYPKKLITETWSEKLTECYYNFVGPMKQYTIMLMKEGSIIRIFNHQNKWYITTSRKLDAFKSKWGSEKSFGEIFEENLKIALNLSIEEFLETLDKNYSYVFRIGTTELTRIVAPAYNNFKLLHCMDKSGKLVYLKQYKYLYEDEMFFTNIKSALDFTNNLKFPFSDGYGVYFTSEHNTYKLINEEYEYYESLRDNTPSINFAYLKNIHDKSKKRQFRKLYPLFKKQFDFYDAELKEICKILIGKYEDRFIYKKEFILPRHEHEILTSLKKYTYDTMKSFNENDEENFEIFMQCLKKINITNINKILNERKLILKQKSKCNLN